MQHLFLACLARCNFDPHLSPIALIETDKLLIQSISRHFLQHFTRQVYIPMKLSEVGWRGCSFCHLLPLWKSNSLSEPLLDYTRGRTSQESLQYCAGLHSIPRLPPWWLFILFPFWASCQTQRKVAASVDYWKGDPWLNLIRSKLLHLLTLA